MGESSAAYSLIPRLKLFTCHIKRGDCAGYVSTSVRVQFRLFLIRKKISPINASATAAPTAMRAIGGPS
jgi:hypothetical protein